MTRKLAIQFVALLALALAALPADAVVIYEDDFSGDGASSLDGAAPDTRPGGETWASGSHLLNNGVQDGAGRFTSLLPFSPTSPGLYTLTADFNVAGTANSWLGMGFTEALAPSGTMLEDRWLDGSNNSRPSLWGLVRPAGSPDADTSFLGYAGGNHTFGGVASSTTNASSLVITIDTTAADWNVTWDFNGDGVDRTETVTAANQPNINYVGFTSTDAAGTTAITHFQLDGPTIPTPANPWDVDGGGSFNTAGNWLNNTVPTTKAVFGDVLTAPNAPAVVTLDSARSLEEVSFQNASSYTLDGPATLTLTGGAELNASSGTHFVNAKLAGSSGLSKTGGGTVVLSNPGNTYTGNTSVAAGTLSVTNLAALNQASGATDIATGATLRLAGDGAGNGANGTFSESIQGGGTLVTDASLTTETITLASANPSYSGQVTVDGGTLRVTNSGALGSTDGTAATGVAVTTGNPETSEGTLQLGGVTVTGELLQIAGRQPNQTAPALTSTGTSEWTGPIVGVAGGNQYNIESQSGLLTLSGDITMPDNNLNGDVAIPSVSSNGRFINLSGAGNGRITGQIVDRQFSFPVDPGDAIPDFANVNVVKSGTGTWTIATTPPATPRDGYHQGRTIINQGTLAVQSSGGSDGELYSRTIEVASGATFDISSFSTYSLQVIDNPDEVDSTGDETGQILSGAGTVNLGGGTLRSFDDSTISPGDTVNNDAVANGTAAIGTLNLTGNYRHSTFTSIPAGSWDFDLGDSTAAGDSDRFVVSGSTLVDAGSGADRINVNLAAGQGSLATGAYTLVQSNSLSFGGSASNSTYNATIVDQNGNDITADTFVTATVQNSGNNIVANVTGSRNLNWAGTAGSAWDVKTTNNWTNPGSTQFGQLDKVTFGNVANKNVTINTAVIPGSTTFNGGAASTYTVTGSGGITGTGPVNVNSGTVKLDNSGNNYSGTTTVASGAKLEVNTATSGSVVLNGTLSIGGSGVATGGAQTFFSDNFSGSGGPLNGTTPSTSLTGASWVAASTFHDDGASVAGAAGGGSATLAFTPVNGSTYTLETTLQNVSGDSDWFGVGFANGQSAATSGNSRFISGTVEGLAWALYRGDASAVANQTFLGDTSVEPNSGLASTEDWLTAANTGGGNVGIRIKLDTTGGAGNWKATMEADTGSGYQVIRANETLLDEVINSIGIANSNAADLTGTINSFSLTGVEPANSRLAGQTLTVDGDFTMGAGSLLQFDFAQNGQDFLDVSGAATLNGTIDVTKLGSFTPEAGTQLTLLSAADGITDLGASFNLPAGFSASIVDSTDLVLSNGIPGDFNNDQQVDGADFLAWQRNVGTPAGLADFQNNYGTGVSAAAVSSAVPEPTSLVLMLAALAGLAVRRNRDGM